MRSCGAALLACAAVSAAAQGIPVTGLQQPARILVDKWGVPHIYAASRSDAFFVQGFNAARDRLFQIDLWRRRGLGDLSSVLGPSYLAQDRAARLFLYRGSMKDEWAAYGPDALETSSRFVAGINAYIDHLGRNPHLLPFEFRQLGYQPARWQAADVVRIRSHGLTRNLTQEFARARVVCQAGLAADAVRAQLSPAWTTRVPAGLDPCLPADALDVFMRATDTVRFGAQRLAARTAIDDDTREGSNSWVLAPSRTATGRPMLASDPHRGYGIPSLRYIVHLNAPGMNIIGAGEPALPGVSIGHNGKVAFGLTIFSIDQEDLYVYQTNPANPGQYRYQGKWENFRAVREMVPVRGRPAQAVELRFTRHGPVIHQDGAAHRALAVRTAWTEPGTAPYFGSISYMEAKNFTQFRRAMENWGAPAENQVYADTAGNIGWVAGGLAPVRPQWDGLMPVPGDGRYEWQGFLDGAKLPHLLNPARGWFASANEMNLPVAFPYQVHKLGFEWPDSARARRISEVLSATPKATMEDMEKLQNDVLSLHARRLQALLRPLTSAERGTQAALRLLGAWNGEQHATSAAAALYEVWWSRHLGRAFREAVLTPSAARAVAHPHAAVLLDALEQPALRFGRGAARKRDRVLLTSLGEAWAEMESLQGPDPRTWQWGRLHFSLFTHPLAPLVSHAARAHLNVGPLPRGGGPFTVNVSTYHPASFWQTHGASFRMVLDVGNWDNSRAINTPGQSGDPASPHYRDLAASWAEGKYFPLLYSADAVKQAATQVIELTPAR
ncbi:penicillin acylase family protein [Massilia sp. PAMC28688]|uniref:penicillin acylase family protein n=1 Tax=Massilia sp. PAMC28688 TaxID=2861283 RepID=UPI001C62C609|nr:penicillin acylase family protein [Massilia sp. PAMC28688]QYF94583.1 penicillin acylase family protein [Massilia sp. PAMC28688]